MMTCHTPRIILAAPKSGSGKTTVTAALLSALKERGLSVQAFKAGPDFIDPMYQERITGRPSINLDTYLAGTKMTASLFAWHCMEQKTDLAVIEGVMGLFDGAGGIAEDGSTYDLARALDCPILLAVDAKGMGRSLLAVLAGFLSMDTSHLIRGVLLNRVSGPFARTLAKLVEDSLQLPVVGCFPEEKALHLESRHLGLKLPGENSENDVSLHAAGLLEANADVERILTIARAAPALSAPGSPFPETKAAPFRAAIARDEAFCFVYQDNLNLLRAMGAEIVPFSPLHDRVLPEGIQGLYLPGGYPELHAGELSENVSMREDIKKKLQEGLPCIAECGGFLYLLASMEDMEGERYPMAGFLPGNAVYTGHLVRFGYLELSEKTPRFLGVGETIRGHEFHYYEATDCGSACTAGKPVSHRRFACVHETGNQFFGFPHLYWPSCPSFAEHFSDFCRAFGRKEEV